MWAPLLARAPAGLTVLTSSSLTPAGEDVGVFNLQSAKADLRCVDPFFSKADKRRHRPSIYLVPNLLIRTGLTIEVHSAYPDAFMCIGSES